MKDEEISQTPPAALPPATLSVDEVRRCTQLLAAVAENRLLLASLSEEDRNALLASASRVVHPDRGTMSRMAKALRRERKQVKRTHDRNVRATTEIRSLRRSPVFTVPQLPPPPPSEEPERILEVARNCYVCKAEYRKLHFFYDSMCIPCADFNYAKRTQRAPLSGKVALITGARVKIGYQASADVASLGRAGDRHHPLPQGRGASATRESPTSRSGPTGCTSTASICGTRPASSSSRGTSSRRTTGWTSSSTTRPRRCAGRPASTRTCWTASCAPSTSCRRRCARCSPDTRRASRRCSPPSAMAAGTPRALGTHLAQQRSRARHPLVRRAVAAARMPSSRRATRRPSSPRAGWTRTCSRWICAQMNSWRMKLAEVSTAEMLEVHLVNAVAPFILCGKLKPLMMRDRSKPGHIVNVSAMEGSFSRGTKTDKHPHTNMAKAALNMMTLTSAPDYARDGIFMNAVDTGWVTDEDPAVHAERKVKELDFQPPLDIVDGAARVVDPVISSESTGDFVWGNFFKDYRHTNW